jgi:hypothetical protein
MNKNFNKMEDYNNENKNINLENKRRIDSDINTLLNKNL